MMTCEMATCEYRAVARIAYGCLNMHMFSNWVCEGCLQFAITLASKNAIHCHTCNHLCAEFVYQYPKNPIIFTAMPGDPEDCAHQWTLQNTPNGWKESQCVLCGAWLPL